MSSFNKVLIIGRVGQAPELKYTPSSTAVCNISVATTEKWNDKAGNKQEKTEWHRVTLWGKTAELTNQYVNKGSLVFVEGKLETKSWDDKETGKKRYSTEVNASNIRFLSSNKETNEALQEAHEKSTAGDYQVSSDTNFASDDIPF